jgi:hypothetical protein
LLQQTLSLFTEAINSSWLSTYAVAPVAVKKILFAPKHKPLQEIIKSASRKKHHQ